jgi:carboxyl-terminal processing protease
MLEKNQYLKMPFDPTVSSEFLDTYLETLDPQHIHFTQGDLAEFEPYRTNLSRLTLNDRHVGDTRPACIIFNRFFERLSQRTAYAEQLLKNEKFTFDSDDRIMINRKGQPYATDLDAAKKLWRERLRFEYLQELLGKVTARKKKDAVAAKKATTSPQANAKGRAAEMNAVAAAAPGADQRHQPLLQSPKAADRIPASSVAANQSRAQVGQAASSEWSTLAGPAPAPTKAEADDIVATLSHRYHRNLRFFEDWNNEDVLQYYLSALTRVYDPHSEYMGRAFLQTFAMQMNLSLFGIGAELTLSEDGYCTIRRLLAGGPAIKGKKIKEGDRVIAVAQGDQAPVDIVDLSLNKAVELIRGPKGTEVRLTIIPAGGNGSDRTEVSIIRDEIPLEESAAKARIIELPNGHGGNQRLGVINLPSFYSTFDTVSKDKPEPKSSTTDVARLLKKLEKENVEGIILDLRGNGGGSLEEAIRLTGLFIKTGPVVLVKDVDGSVQEADDTDPSVLYDGPLVVLANRGSASASEIVAAALQDYGRAVVVGDRATHGKGTVQSVTNLRPYVQMLDQSLTNEPGAVKLTIKKFYRPNGASTQLRGVVPDIILPSVANESKDIGEDALDHALKGDKLPEPAKYEHLNRVEPYLSELRKRSEERIASDKEYGYIREDIERFKTQQADKSVSLNERVRLKEAEEQEARAKARDKERRMRPEPPEKVFELTLKDLDQPGLGKLIPWTNSVASASAHASTGASAVGTNSVAAASSKLGPTDPDADDSTEAPAPTIDPPLTEAEHILIDYLSLFPNGNLVTIKP